MIHLTEKDGLPDIEFYDVFRDSRGYIWLAADKGLFKYDGKNFIGFSHREKRGLSVFNLQEDDAGRVWCRNISGQIFYVENDKMHLFYDLDIVRFGMFGGLYFIEDKVMLFGPAHYYIIDWKTRKVEQKKERNFEGYNEGFLFKGRLYAYLDGKVKDFTENYEGGVLFEDKGVGAEFLYSGVIPVERGALFYDKSERYFLTFVDIEAKKIRKIKVPDALVSLRWSAVDYIDGKYWFCTNKGVYTYRLEKDSFIFETRFLEPYFTTSVAIDAYDNHWVSTIDAGVFVIPNINVRKYDIPTAVSNIKVVKNYKNQSLALGSFDGSIGVYDPLQETYSLIEKQSSKVSEMMYFKNRDLLFVANDIGSLVYENELVQPLRGFSNTKDLSKINDTIILASSYASSFLIDIRLGKNSQILKVLNSKRSFSCYYDPLEGDYYVGNVDQLRRYDENFKEHIVTYKEASIFAQDIVGVDRTIWVTTYKDGILGIENDSVVKVYDTTNGLPTNKASHMYSEEGLLWAVTHEGVVRIDPTTDTVEILTQQDGIPSYNINGITSIDNTVFFASNEGLFSVDKQEVFIDRKPPEIEMTQVTIGGVPMETQSTYTLRHDQNQIKFQVTTNGFQTDKNIVYQYQLSGDPDSWETLEKGVDQVSFSSLADGEYIFSVRAKNRFSNQLSEPMEVRFLIPLPFWERWWFVLGIILVAGLFTILYIKRVLLKRRIAQNMQVKQLKIDNEMTALKLENLRSQMNPHFIFNALNSIQEYILLNKKEEAGNYLGKFAHLIRSYLNNSVEEELTIASEIESLKMYLHLEKMRFEDTFTYDFDVSDALHTDTLFIPTMLLQPYIENAIKHGLLHKEGMQQLYISMRLEDSEMGSKKLICVIEDNGIGRKSSQEMKAKRSPLYKSFATKATENRLKLLNKGKKEQVTVKIIDLYNPQGLSKGTRVVLSIPTRTDV